MSLLPEKTTNHQAMTAPNLWKQIRDFEFDSGNVQFSFLQRLARENNWSINYTRRVLLEYKKFIYLCAVSKQPITPSDAVDQAWHLHLTYTQSYWEELCQKTLKRNLHHHPTKGGKSEQEKFSGCYDATFEMYVREFHQEPPNDIWLDHDTRFKQVHFKRINLDDYWVIKKPSKSVQRVCSVLLLVIPALFILTQASGGSEAIIAIAIIILLFIISAFFFKGGGDNNGCSSDWDDHHHHHHQDSNSDSGVGCIFDGCSGHGHHDSGCSSSGCSNSN